MKWIYMAYQINSLLVSIKNTNKYNFEEKDITNPRPNKYLQYIHVCYAEPLI